VCLNVGVFSYFWHKIVWPDIFLLFACKIFCVVVGIWCSFGTGLLNAVIRLE